MQTKTPMQNELSPAIFTPEGQVILDKPTYTAMLRIMLGVSVNLTKGETVEKVYTRIATHNMNILSSSMDEARVEADRAACIHHYREATHFLNEWYDLETGRR